MKKFELQSIKEAVKQGDYIITLNSYGTSGSGYLVNYRLEIKDKTHQNRFNRQTYFVCFSAHTWYKVKYEGVSYNFRWLDKYAQYDNEMEAVIHDRVRLAEALTD